MFYVYLPAWLPTHYMRNVLYLCTTVSSLSPVIALYVVLSSARPFSLEMQKFSFSSCSLVFIRSVMSSFAPSQHNTSDLAEFFILSSPSHFDPNSLSAVSSNLSGASLAPKK